MAAIEDESESVEENSPAYNRKDSDQTPWKFSQTRMLIAHFKDNPILWNKRLKDNGNRSRTKKASSSIIIIIIKITSNFLFCSH